MNGIVFDIQRFSTHDGPGIRTTVFFKGCSLNCFWCHNPESIRPGPELLFTQKKCIGCGRCVEACPCGAIAGVRYVPAAEESGSLKAAGQKDKAAVPLFFRNSCRETVHNTHDWQQSRALESNSFLAYQKRAAAETAACLACGACANVCPANALEISGREMTVEEVMTQVEKDAAFYKRSGGGVTASGGEALLQSKFVAALFAACKERDFHTVLDTAGNVPYSAFEEVLPFTDLILYDIKAADPKLHKRGCGAGNARILDNLRRLCEAGANVRLRIPVIPGFNDSAAAMDEIGELIRGLSGERGADLLRFHGMGALKYESLRRPYPAGELVPPDDARMKTLAEVLRNYCGDVQIQ